MAAHRKPRRYTPRRHEFNKRGKSKELKPAIEVIPVEVTPVIDQATFDAGLHGCFGARDGGVLGGASSAASGAQDLRIALADALSQIWA